MNRPLPSTFFRRLAIGPTGAALIAGVACLVAGSAGAESPEKTAEIAQSELYFGSYLISDRPRQRSLAAADELIAQGRFGDAIPLLDGLLGAPEDSFDAASASLKQAAEARLAELPATGRRTHALLYGAAARREIAAALATLDSAKLAEMVARFPPQFCDGDAWRALAAVEAEKGRYGRAALLLAELVDAGAKPTADERRRLDALRARTGDAAGEASEPSDAWLRATTAAARQAWEANRSPSAWLGPGGDASQTSRAPGDAPTTWRRWRAALSPAAAAELRLDRLARRVDHKTPRVAAVGAVAVDNVLVTPTPEALVAVDARSGKRLWQATLGGRPTPPAWPGGGGELDPMLDPLAERAWLDRVRGGVTTDGERVFVVGDTALPPSPSRSGRFQLNRSGFEAPANSLHAYAIREQGKLAWRVDGGDRATALAGAHFLGPPIADEGWLYGLAVIDESIALLLLEAATGELLWRQPLVSLERGLAENTQLRLIGATPTLANNLVICPTGAGVVVAVDPYRRRLVWAHRLTVEPERVRNAGRRDWRGIAVGSGAAWRQQPGWRSSKAVVSGDRVVVATPESPRLHCLDLPTGAVLWSKKHADAALLAGVASLTGEGSATAAVVVEQDTIAARDIATGRTVWRAPLSEGNHPAGNSLLLDGALLTPLVSGELAITRLSADAPESELLAVGGDPLDTGADGGTLAYHRGAVFVRSPTDLWRFDQRGSTTDEPTGVVDAASDSGDWAEATRRLADAFASAGGAPTELRDRYAAALVQKLTTAANDDGGADDTLNRLDLPAAARRRLAVVRVAAASRAGDFGAAVDAAIALSERRPERLAVKIAADHQVSAERWAAARLRSLAADKTGSDRRNAADRMQALMSNADASRSAALRLFLNAIAPGADEPGAAQRAAAEVAPDTRWATRQVRPWLDVDPTRQSPPTNRAGRRRRSQTQDPALPLRQGGPPPETTRRWRLQLERSEARLIIGSNADGERDRVLRLPAVMDARVVRTGAGRPANWRWGDRLVIAIESGVCVYDTSAEDALLWCSTEPLPSPGESIALPRDNRPATPKRASGNSGAERVLWVASGCVVTHRGAEMTARDLDTGRLLWRRPITGAARVLGDDRRVLIDVGNRRRGEIVSLLDGGALGVWSPPAGEWRAADGPRVLVTTARRGRNEIALYDFGADRDQPSGERVWRIEPPADAAVAPLSEHGLAILDPEGNFGTVDLRTGGGRTPPELSTRLASRPTGGGASAQQRIVSLQAHDVGDALLVVINRVADREHVASGVRRLGTAPVATGEVHCLDKRTGAPRWPAPAVIDAEGRLESPVAGCPLAFFGARRVDPGVAEAPARLTLTAIDLASGRSVYRNADLPTGGSRVASFWVQREAAPDPRLLVTLGPARLALDLTDAPSPPAPPLQVAIEQRGESDSGDLMKVGRGIGRLIESMISPPEGADSP